MRDWCAGTTLADGIGEGCCNGETHTRNRQLINGDPVICYHLEETVAGTTDCSGACCDLYTNGCGCEQVNNVFTDCSNPGGLGESCSAGGVATLDSFCQDQRLACCNAGECTYQTECDCVEQGGFPSESNALCTELQLNAYPGSPCYLNDEGCWRVVSSSSGVIGGPCCETTDSVAFDGNCSFGTPQAVARNAGSGTFTTTCTFDECGNDYCIGRKPSGNFPSDAMYSSTQGTDNTATVTYQYEDCGISPADYEISIVLERCEQSQCN